MPLQDLCFWVTMAGLQPSPMLLHADNFYAITMPSLYLSIDRSIYPYLSLYPWMPGEPRWSALRGGGVASSKRWHMTHSDLWSLPGRPFHKRGHGSFYVSIMSDECSPCLPIIQARAEGIRLIITSGPISNADDLPTRPWSWLWHLQQNNFCLLCFNDLLIRCFGRVLESLVKLMSVDADALHLLKWDFSASP